MCHSRYLPERQRRTEEQRSMQQILTGLGYKGQLFKTFGDINLIAQFVKEGQAFVDQALRIGNVPLFQGGATQGVECQGDPAAVAHLTEQSERLVEQGASG